MSALKHEQSSATANSEKAFEDFQKLLLPSFLRALLFTVLTSLKFRQK